jgi:hypothetical protein
VSRIPAITAAWLSAANAFLPVVISYSTAPSAKMSVRLSTRLPSSCSGAMYDSVPRIVPGAVTLADRAASIRPGAVDIDFAIPKSSSFTPDFVRKTFAGFKSR